MTTGRINQINNYVNDKETVICSPLRSLVTLAYLVSVIIKNNIKVLYSNKSDLDTLSATIMKPVRSKCYWKDTKD